MKYRTLPALVLLATLLADIPLAAQQVQVQGNMPHRRRPRDSWALVVGSANDLHNYEVRSQELTELIQSGIQPPLQDRDAFPAQALQGYFALRDSLGFSDGAITLMLYHDDQPPNTSCEIPVNLIDNDDGNDQFVDLWGVPPGGGVNWLWGPNGVPGDADDPQIDYENAAVTKDALQQAIAQLGQSAGLNDTVVLYLVDHGLNAGGGMGGRFYFEAGLATPDPNDDFVSGEEFDAWLDSAFCGSHLLHLFILADFCDSQAFLDPLLEDQGCEEGRRVGIAAADRDRLAWYTADAFLINFINPGMWPCPQFPVFSGSHFFHPFWEGICAGEGIHEAFARGWNAWDCWGNGRVGALQRPVLSDHGLALDVEIDLMQSGASLYGYQDIEWRPDSDYALIVGNRGIVDKYYWGPTANPGVEAYQTLRLRGPGTFDPTLRAVAWDEDGSEALLCGDMGTVLCWDGASFAVVPPETPGDSTSEDLWGVDYSWPSSEAEEHGVEALIVGDGGTILKYDGSTYSKLVPDGVCPWSPTSADLRDVSFNRMQQYEPPPIQGMPAITTTEATLVGMGGIWTYEFKNHEYMGDPTLNYTCERIFQFYPTVPTAITLELMGVEWDPHARDFALICGRYTPSFSSPVGIVYHIDPADALTARTTAVVNELLYDVDFEPDGTRAAIAGSGGTLLWHSLGDVGDFERFDPFTSPAVPTNAALRGIDFRPSGSHAAAVGTSEVIVRCQERLDM